MKERFFNLFSQANALISNGLYYVQPFWSYQTKSNASVYVLPTDKIVCDYTEVEKNQFVAIQKQQQWDIYHDMTLEDRCFFISEHLIPETYEPEWNNKAKIFSSDFITWVTYAHNEGLISEEHAKELTEKAEYYCNAVAAERQWEKFYPLYKATIKAKQHFPDNTEIKNNYSAIPVDHRKKIEVELLEEKKISTRQIILLTWFTFLQSGLFQTRIYYPGNPNLPLSPEEIDIVQTQNNVNGFFHGFIQLFSDMLNWLDQVPVVGLFMLPGASAKSVDNENDGIFKIFPHFLTGTASYQKSVEEQIDESIKNLHSQLYQFLEQNDDKSKALVVGEIHDTAFFSKLHLLNYLNQWLRRQNKISQVVVVHEMVKSEEGEAGLQQMLTVLNNYPLERNPKAYLESVFQFYCFNQQDEFRVNMLSCLALIAGIYSFPFKLSNYDINLTKNERAKIRYLKSHYPDPLLIFNPMEEETYRLSEHYVEARTQTVEESIENTTLDLLQHHKNTLVVIFTGKFHIKGITDRILNENYPVTSLNLDNNNAQAINRMFSKLTDYCIKPVTVPNAKISHYLAPIAYTTGQCDRVLHKSFEKINKAVKKVSESNQMKIPREPGIARELTDFFLPSKTVRYLKTKMQNEEQVQERFKQEL